jgi:hypothetical protein
MPLRKAGIFGKDLAASVLAVIYPSWTRWIASCPLKIALPRIFIRSQPVLYAPPRRVQDLED